MELNDRSKDILKAVIQTYVETGSPVGSRYMSRRNKYGLSAASIRNIMADLEEAGYLTHPHTSAGRVPTDKGYRFYVDSLMDKKALSATEIGRIHRGLQVDDTTENLMVRTSHVLAQVSGNIGIVVSPPITRVILQRIEFLKLPDGKILVILVSHSGLVQDKVIRLSEELSQPELDRAACYLMEKFSGKSLLEIRAEIIRLMSQEKALYDRLLQNVILLSNRGLYEEANSEIYVDGTSRLAEKPEFCTIGRMRELFETFEQKQALVKIISECIRDDALGARIVIGSENRYPGLRKFSIVASPYHCDDRVMGTLGIVGPTRLEYGKAVPVVEYVANLFGQILGTAH